MSDIVYKKFTFSTPFLSGFKVLKIPIISHDGKPAWPELFPIEKINEMRKNVGLRHFSAQMMLEFIAPDRVRLDPNAFNIYSDEFDPHIARIGDNNITGVCAYWDPSTGRRGRDGSVCVIVYRDDKNHRVFIHDILYLSVSDNDTHPLTSQCDSVIDFIWKYNIHRIAIETNGIGNALPEIIRDVSARRGTKVIVQKITNNKNKEIRILDAIEPMLSSGRIYVHNRIGASPLFAEMMTWSPIGGGHDDGLDAVAGALQTMPVPVRATGGRIRTFSANTSFSV